MSDIETALVEGQRLLEELRDGKLSAYLDLHRHLAAHRLHASDIGATNAALRGLWRDGILAEARVALAALKDGDRNQYLVIVKTLAIIGETPEAIGTTAEELRRLWRDAEIAVARDAASRLLGGDRLARDEVLDHLAILNADPEAVGLTFLDLCDIDAP